MGTVVVSSLGRRTPGSGRLEDNWRAELRGGRSIISTDACQVVSRISQTERYGKDDGADGQLTMSVT